MKLPHSDSFSPQWLSSRLVSFRVLFSLVFPDFCCIPSVKNLALVLTPAPQSSLLQPKLICTQLHHLVFSLSLHLLSSLLLNSSSAKHSRARRESNGKAAIAISSLFLGPLRLRLRTLALSLSLSLSPSAPPTSLTPGHFFSICPLPAGDTPIQYST
jgi:hypothetical protein